MYWLLFNYSIQKILDLGLEVGNKLGLQGEVIGPTGPTCYHALCMHTGDNPEKYLYPLVGKPLGCIFVLLLKTPWACRLNNYSEV